ncbi:MAG: M23 family metallopeptidase [Firmicutes bacterium]|nr:M23 family metallopeptidase [Bacillota bacterium]
MKIKQFKSGLNDVWESWKGRLARIRRWGGQGWGRFYARWRLLVGVLSFLLLLAIGWGIGRGLNLPAISPLLVVEEAGKGETATGPETPPEDLRAVVQALQQDLSALRQRLETKETPRLEGEAEAAPSPIQWIPPVTGKVVRESGWEKKGGEWRYHSGIDLTVPPGTPVRAAAAGKVGALKTDVTLGTAVTLEHRGGWRSLYGHLAKVQVTVGQEITEGTVLGYSSPAACGPEPGIHFNLYQQENPVNPLTIIVFPQE